MQKKIRDVERLIRKRGETEELLAKLAEFKSTKKANEMSLIEKKHAEKYHMVKFFERKKLVRKIMSLDSKIAAEESKKAKAKLGLEREKLIDDLCYVLYYPKSMKYVAIFANNNEDDNQLAAPDTRSEQARTLARTARDEDIASGAQDKVIYAIEVGQGLHKASNSEEGHEDDGVSDNDDDGDHDVSEKSSKKRKISSGTQKGDIAPSKKQEYSRPTAAPIVPKDVTKKSRTSDDVADIADDEPTIKKQKKDKKMKESSQEKSTPAAIEEELPAASNIDVDAGDSFFLEEAPEGDDSGPNPAQLHKIAIGDIRNAAHTFRNGGN